MDTLITPPPHNTLVVRPRVAVSASEREAVLREVEYNVFAFPAALVTCDFLSDSGTSAMTDVQWAAMMRGDESYGRNSGYYCLLDAFRDIFERGSQDKRQNLFRDVLAGTADATCFQDGFLCENGGGFVNGGRLQLMRPNFFIVPQGRCAEALLFSTMADTLRSQSTPLRDSQQNHVGAIISNGFFDTTGANASVSNFELHTFTQPGLTDPFPVELVGKENPFKGNLDIEAASSFLSDSKNAQRTQLILLTITNNWAAGQPVSMANIRAAAALAQQHGIPLFFDACRFAENAKFIQDFEPGFASKTIAEIVAEMFTHADGFLISLKKDGLANMGGVLCFRDEGVFASRFGADIGIRLKERQILTFGNDSYGGMSGRDLMAAAAGLYEVTKETYLEGRLAQVREFAQKLVGRGIPLLLPPGGSAVFLDMNGFFDGCGRSYGDFAGVGFTLQLLSEYGIRSAEAGPFGWEWDKKKSSPERDSIPNLVRFAVPRNVMTDRHIDYTVEAIKQLHERRHTLPNARITRGADLRIRHFQSGLEPVPVVLANEDPVLRSPSPASTISTISLSDDTNPSSTDLSLAAVDTFLSKAQRDMLRLSGALDLDNNEENLLMEALQGSMEPWGNAVVPEKPTGWMSDTSNDHSPIEYSVAIEQNTGLGQLRFLIEAQAEENSIQAYQKSALKFTNFIREKYPGAVSLERFHSISDLFFPDSTTAQGAFAAWHSFVVGAGAQPEWKIYLNPRAGGLAEAANVIRETLHRLGMPDAFKLMDDMMNHDMDKFLFFSLDLCTGPDARVKVYVQHNAATADNLAERIASAAPESSSAAEIRRFLSVLSGRSKGAFENKPLITCFAFTRACGSNQLKTEATLHFPVSHYVPDDAEISRRVEQYLEGSDTAENSSKSQLKLYRKCLDAVAHRPLDQGPGIHSWVGLKMTRKRGRVVTFYLGPEMYTPEIPI